MIELPITSKVIENILDNSVITKAIPYLQSVKKLLDKKPTCSTCKKKVSAGDQARIYQAVKHTLQVMSKAQLATIKKELKVDALVIFNTAPNGTAKKIVL